MIDTDINDFKVGDFVCAYVYLTSQPDGNCDRGPVSRRALGEITNINDDIITLDYSDFSKFHYKQCRLVTDIERFKLTIESELSNILAYLRDLDKFIENSKDLHFAVKRKYKAIIQHVENRLKDYNDTATST